MAPRINGPRTDFTSLAAASPLEREIMLRSTIHTSFARLALFLPLLVLSWLGVNVDSLQQSSNLEFDSAYAADIGYIYDELGRLRAVIDPNSDTAIYNMTL